MGKEGNREKEGEEILQPHYHVMYCTYVHIYTLKFPFSIPVWFVYGLCMHTMGVCLGICLLLFMHCLHKTDCVCLNGLLKF